MAQKMRDNPPEGVSKEQAEIEAQRILMMPILTAQTTNAVAQLCDGLDKLTGLQREENSSQINLFFNSDPRHRQ